ncbi:MAG: protein kinase [Acidobacteriota bacterium]|nr:protein kinase [Acidobacteriota bacterium]
MALTAGTRVGPYEIIAALGAGGMGEVYRARDTRLKREVAVKILPPSLAADMDRLARLQREAEVLASLNHPHIAAIYGLEEADGVKALVMELVDGEDLSERIRRGPLSIDDALAVAKQIAAALEAAHERGIIHRDLKPANIKVRPDGTVKVLDFGLAKAMEPTGAAASDAAESPTITALAMTEAGVILGTAAYMSPEQACGKPVDRRTDIWAFGCVLYEMLTGKRAFGGETTSETRARVIEREPDWFRLPTTLSPAIGTYLRRCLQKDPRQRVQAIGDVRLALEGAFETAVPPLAALAIAPHRRRTALVGAAAILASAAIIGTLGWSAIRPAERVPPHVSRLQVAPLGSAALSVTWNDRDLAITPDGSRVVYVGNGGTQLFVRALDALAPVAVFTGMPRGPFVSVDGQWIGFADGRGVLKRVAVTGGPAVTLARFDTTGPVGATWGPDDTIIVATANVTTGLLRVSAADGSITLVTRPDHEQGEADHFWPEMLPGDHAVLFTITALAGGLDAAQVAVLDLQTGKHRVLVRGGSHAHYVSSALASPARAGDGGGHLVYAAAGTLRAVPFDLASLEGAFDTAATQTAAPAVAAQRRRVALVGVATTIASGAIIGTLVWATMRPAQPMPPRVSRLQVTPSGPAALSIGWNDRDLAITPDGARIIYVGNRSTQLFVRGLDALASVAVYTGQPSGPFVSPDSQWIGFVDGLGLLKKVAVTGGPAVTLATLDTAGPSGATWGPDDTIIVATNSVATGLQQVAAAGGPMTVLTRPDREQGEADHFWPEMLPGGRAVLFTITALTGGSDAAQVAVLDLQTGKRRVLVRGGSHAHYGIGQTWRFVPTKQRRPSGLRGGRHATRGRV